MDAILNVGAIAGMLAVGGFLKHRTTLDHKKWGPLVNLAGASLVTGAATALSSGEPNAGEAIKGALSIWVGTEFGVNALKSGHRLVTGGRAARGVGR